MAKRSSLMRGKDKYSVSSFNPHTMRGSLNCGYRKHEMIRINQGNKVSYFQSLMSISNLIFCRKSCSNYAKLNQALGLSNNGEPMKKNRHIEKGTLKALILIENSGIPIFLPISIPLMKVTQLLLTAWDSSVQRQEK